jgi:hypothetical protein
MTIGLTIIRSDKGKQRTLTLFLLTYTAFRGILIYRTNINHLLIPASIGYLMDYNIGQLIIS